MKSQQPFPDFPSTSTDNTSGEKQLLLVCACDPGIINLLLTNWTQCLSHSMSELLHRSLSSPLSPRELDLSVFAALQFGPVSRTLLDTDMHTKEREELSVMPQQLSFLLQDLSHKLSSSLSRFGSRGLEGTKVNPPLTL